MDIVITGRHQHVSDRFREHIHDKLDKVAQLAPRARRIEVVVSHEPNRRQAKSCDRVEITCHIKGPVVRAEACQEDKYAALDLALDKLLERLRRKHDRAVRRGRHEPAPVLAPAGGMVLEEMTVGGTALGGKAPGGTAPGGKAQGAPAGLGADSLDDLGEVPEHADRWTEEDTDHHGVFADSPIEVREKVHRSAPMTLEQALREMELVGHDFFLFHDVETDRASVVYRRRGWSYGVLHLDLSETASAEGEEPARAS